MSSPGLVVVGAGLAGVAACESARREGYTEPITLLGAESYLPYDRPPLSKELLLGEAAPTIPALRERDRFEELDIDVWTDAPALGLDTQSRIVTTGRGDLPYRHLVIACGASSRELPGTAGVSGIHTLRTYADAEAIWKRLQSPARVVVIGAGFIGAEVASAARSYGHPVTIVEAAPAPLTRSLGVEGGALCAELHARNGTELVLGVGVAEVMTDTSGQAVRAIRLTDGRTLDADLVVVGIGAVPSTEWLADSEIALNSIDGGIECDATLAVLTNSGDPIEGIWAGGDVAHWPNALFDRRMRLEHWASASEQGALAARNAVAVSPAHTYTAVPYFWSDWYGTRLQFVGTSHADELLVQHRVDKTGGTVVLYRSGTRLTGVLTIGRPDLIMKYRRFVVQADSWCAGVDFGADRCR
ncbi:FAD/NAD(P)-binding oxidoreductase [Rhodococcus sp. APC 3903]|uniref:NAD(P)/FAD-dependent oxidoreductase n=1 Tax=Rhodococcus sp. APC 3903 TaxID=3035193 RepID=UPI0025B2BC0D|nr:FAD/NAD(P)-binding oxidoreductase [Rhodococcus sp. APC 3903]MDN3459922.1 FAD/NAD(P)-binding oxidoreductase [Rhodococcus sp. APC 3903]